MLTASDLAGMRDTVVESLPDLCTVIARDFVSDGAGGHTYEVRSRTDYACRVSPRLATGTAQLKDAEIEIAGRITDQAPWLVTLPYETPVSALDQIADQHGRTFEVFAGLSPRSNELSTLVLVRLIGEGAG